ncbi:MAG: hypothetical protein CL879_11045 [Dehalococcoidia bacterium]|nr:hypothetical protein [Dehalococcoidia bacterium]
MTADRQEFWNEIWSRPIETHPDPDQLLIENTRNLTPGRSLDIGSAYVETSSGLRAKAGTPQP